MSSDASRLVGWLLCSLMVVVFHGQVDAGLEFKRRVRNCSSNIACASFVRLPVFVGFAKLWVIYFSTQVWDAIHTSRGSWGCRGRRSRFDVIIFVEWSFFSVMADVFWTEVVDSVEFKRHVRIRNR